MSEENAETEYRVLARKYRPDSFEDLIGQEPMVRTLTNAFATNRIAQAYMLTGVRGVGKTTTARILARALNYETDSITSPTLDLSEPGIHCPSIMEGNHVDVIEMDAASHTGIGDIREIIASVRYKPISARYKVYIIDEVHMLSNAAFNGLLKTLEEPPEHVKFIFATTEIRKVPITVLSRCQRFDLRRIDAGEMTEHLKKIAGLENIEAEDEALAMIARAGEGSARDALSLLDQAIAHSAGSGGGKILADDVRSMLGLADRARVIDLFEHIMKGDIASALSELKDQYDVGADPATVLTDLAEFVHFVTRVRYVETALDDPSLSQEEKTRGKEFAEKLSPRILGRAWQMLLKGIAEVQSSPRPLAAADMVMVRITHAADLPTPDEALKKLGDGTAPNMPSGSGTGGGGQAPQNGGGSAVSSSSIATNGGSGNVLKQVANGPSLVIDNNQQPEVSPTEIPRDNPTPLQAVHDRIETLSDLLEVAEKKRDIKFKLLLRNNFSEISFAPGRIEFKPVGNNAPRNIAQILDVRLREWTGKQWEIIVSEEAGDATIKEIELATHEKNISDAESDPTVAAALMTFPNSKIKDIRFLGAGENDGDGLDEGAVMEAALENPDADMETEDAVSENQNANIPNASSLDDYFN
ncbi:MAG: DNA polymerase III subunit gamma/tau [Rhizobiaceae bacterium]